MTKWQNNYETCVQAITVRSVNDILVSENPSLAALKVADPILPYDVLVTLINDYLDFLSIGKTMSGQQVISTAKLMLEDYSLLKPDDFVLFFNRCKKGHYGTIYDRMDGAQLFEWLEKYMYDRDTEIETIRQIEQKQRSKELNKINDTVGLPDYFKPLMEKKVVTEKPVVERQPTPQELIVKQFIADFDKEAELIGSKKFLTRIGRKMDIGEFLNYRIQGIS